METEKNVLLVLTNYNYNDEEYDSIRQIIEDSGMGVKIAASEPGVCTGIKGGSIEVDFTFPNVTESSFNAVVFIGGPAIDVYLHDDAVFKMIKKFFEFGKVIGAISWAPAILANSGILAQKKVTVWDGAKEDITAVGAQYTGEPITVDRTIVTANSSDVAKDFAQTVVNMINETAE